MALLELKNLHVALEDGTAIVKGVDLDGGHRRGARDHGPERLRQVDARLRDRRASRLRDHEGQILLDGEDVTEAGADERAQTGLFLAFQYPHAIPGVTVTDFLRTAINSIRKAKGGGATTRSR